MNLIIYAQNVSDIKKEFNDIKKNPEFIYGQSSGEDEEKCYEIAYEDFLVKLKEHIASDKTLSNASALIVQKMQKSIKKISFERYINCKVVCVYINKNDIKPISQSDIIDTTKIAVPVIIKTVVEQKADAADNELTDVPKPTEKPQDPIIEKAEIPDGPLQQIARLSISVGNDKENEILYEIANLNDFNKIMAYLNNRKVSDHDVVYKATTQYGSIINAYWLVFDKNKKLTAILTKDKKIEILANTTTNSRQYDNSPKVWLQVY